MVHLSKKRRSHKYSKISHLSSLIGMRNQNLLVRRFDCAYLDRRGNQYRRKDLSGLIGSRRFRLALKNYICRAMVLGRTCTVT